MSRNIEAPKIDRDSKNLAINSVIEVSKLRTEDLPKIDALHVREDKRLLKTAAQRLLSLGIFPTITFVGQFAGSEQKAHDEKLLFAKTVALDYVYEIDYYLNPEGELVSYSRGGEQTERRRNASDKEYISYTADALLAVENRIRDAMDERPKLRILRDE